MEGTTGDARELDAFLIEEALTNIAETTLANLEDLAAGRSCPNAVLSPG